MPKKRDDFPKPIRKKLGERVAYKCSFPGCNRNTIGPNHESELKVTTLGKASHICAAAKNGPRFDPNMASGERSGITNGIWLCPQHADLIDHDKTEYSAESIRQWKKIAEESAYTSLLNISSNNYPTTLVALGNDIVFEGIWVSINENKWKFKVKRADINKLKDYSNFINNIYNNYVVIETQGDGRIINPPFYCGLVNNGEYEISLNVNEKSKRISPNDIVSDFAIENGDFKIIKGIELAKQRINFVLGLKFGDLHNAPLIGSYISKYYIEYKHDIKYLERLLKLEITRLISIPEFDRGDVPILNFINRINDIQILNIELIDDKLKIKMCLEWGDGTPYEDVFDIYIRK